MRKVLLVSSLLVAAMGFGGFTATSAFAAACLNPDAGMIDLSHDAMKPGAGWGYDMDGYNKEMAQGNKCTVTQQSQPVSDTSDQVMTKHKAKVTYN